jgi:flagellar protein FlaG
MQVSAKSAVEVSPVVKTNDNAPLEKVGTQVNSENADIAKEDRIEVTKEKIEQAVNSMNEFLEINHRSTRFVYHDELERYYVTVIDQQTQEVIKEIPPKKLLDAFYEMQKLVGMIIDEKI